MDYVDGRHLNDLIWINFQPTRQSNQCAASREYGLRRFESPNFAVFVNVNANGDQHVRLLLITREMQKEIFYMADINMDIDCHEDVGPVVLLQVFFLFIV